MSEKSSSRKAISLSLERDCVCANEADGPSEMKLFIFHFFYFLFLWDRIPTKGAKIFGGVLLFRGRERIFVFL